VTGALLAFGFLVGFGQAGPITNIFLLSTPGGPTESPDAKRLILRLWIPRAATLTTVALYAARRARSLMRLLINPLTLTFLIQFYDRIRAAHPEFLWRAPFSCKVFSFTAAGPTQSCQPWRVWQVVARYGVLSRIRFPERALEDCLDHRWLCGNLAGETVSLAFLVGAAAWFPGSSTEHEAMAASHYSLVAIPLLCGRYSDCLAGEPDDDQSPPSGCGVAIVLLSAMLLTFTYRHRLEESIVYLVISRDRTDRISAMSKLALQQRPCGCLLAGVLFRIE